MIGIATALAAIAAAAPTKTELTVYNQGFGLVKEQRSLDLKNGRQTVGIEDVAAMIEPASVSIRSLTQAGSFDVLEQNYQYDLISPTAILNKSVGGKVRFVRTVGASREILEGTLLSAPTAIIGDPNGGHSQVYNGMVIKTDDGRIVLNPQGEVEVVTMPEGLISRPTLLWELDSRRAGTNNVELSYITGGISWKSDYVLNLLDEKSASLNGWVTVNNNSGATYKEANLKLLAGDVARVRPAMMDMMPRGGGGFGGAMSKAEFKEESLFEYHLYTLQRPATVRQNETKQLALLESPSVPYTKKLILDATREFGHYYPSEGQVGTGDIKPQVRVEFVNKKEYGLGMPLPMGNIKVYQRDASGSVQLLGEDSIAHTPRNEKLSLVVGKSFDVVATRLRTDFRRLSSTITEETFEIQIRNQKEVPETVYVLERDWGDWKVLTSSQEFQKLDANTFQFVVPLKAGEAKTVSYTIKTVWG